MKSQEENLRGSAHYGGGQPAPPRKPYAPPRLVVYGDLAVLTETNKNDAPADSFVGSTQTT
jgi:hypothetical protein